MSSMLEQAIIDAASLREAALKNAEQAVVEKYAPEIKAAVQEMLDKDDGSEALNEEAVEAPFAASTPMSAEQPVEMSMEFEFNPEDFNIDLGDTTKPEEEIQEMEAGMEEELPDAEGIAGLDDMAGETGTEPGLDSLETGMEGGNELADMQLQELFDLLNTVGDDPEPEVLDEELTVDVGEVKHGHIVTDEGAREYDKELELAAAQSTKRQEELEELEKGNVKLTERVKSLETNNKKLKQTLLKFNEKLQEALLSNAKLLYSNRILGDASLNERQKTKIVEAIAQAKTTDEAKSLCETLKATVGSDNKKGPQSLSESVQRKSNLSAILPRRKEAQSSPQHDFATRMRKLAGIN